MTMHRSYLLQGIKLALGALTAILLANALGLKYSATAGVITLLSILSTKRETLVVALGRLMAYGSALVIAAVCFRLLGYTVVAFAVFLFLFAVLCCCTGWMYALSMVAVLISHFMAEGNMSRAMLMNETLLLLIGALCGIVVNLTLRANETKMKELIAWVDGEMKQLLTMAAEPARQAEAQAQLKKLDDALAQARELAMKNCGNRLLHASAFDLAYVDMRARQRDILAQILTATGQVKHIPAQHEAVAAFFQQVAEEYRMGNDVSDLQARLRSLLEGMKQEQLPVSREEFESRAVLYYMLVRLRDFLGVKGSFYQEHMK